MTPIRNSRGVSLLETVVAMSLVSTLLLVSAAWIHQSLKFSSSMQQRHQQHQGLLRMSRQFRDDVHHGESVALDPDNRLVIQLSADRQVSYRVVDQQVIRRTRSLSGVPSEDAFPLVTGATVRWDASERPGWISLTVERAEALPELHLRVAVNRFGDSRRAISPRSVEEAQP